LSLTFMKEQYVAHITFSNEIDNPLNIKIREVWKAEAFEECVSFCRDIFQMGFDDGQSFVWRMRLGDFTREEKTCRR
jgi:hypothetical protein